MVANCSVQREHLQGNYYKVGTSFQTHSTYCSWSDFAEFKDSASWKCMYVAISNVSGQQYNETPSYSVADVCTYYVIRYFYQIQSLGFCMAYLLHNFLVYQTPFERHNFRLNKWKQDRWALIETHIQYRTSTKTPVRIKNGGKHTSTGTSRCAITQMSGRGLNGADTCK